MGIRRYIGMLLAPTVAVGLACVVANWHLSGVRRDGDSIFINRSRMPFERVIYEHKIEGMDSLLISRPWREAMLITDYNGDGDPDCVAVVEDGLEPRQYCKGGKENVELYERGSSEWYDYKVRMDIDRRVEAVLNGTSDEVGHTYIHKTR